MMDSWHTVRIGDLCEGIYDGPHATPKKTIDGPIFLGISNLSNGRIDLSNAEHLSEKDYISWTRRIVPQENDVVFSYETRLGEAARIPGGLRCCLGRRMALMRPNLDKVHPTFLHFAYLSPSFQETIRARTVRGSTVDRIALIEFPDFPITIPADLDEQRTIAHMLGSLDDKIELNRRMNATLEESACVLFKSWFVDFNPVRAKMEGRQPEGIDAETAALFPDRLVESTLGMIPEGWQVRALGEISEKPQYGFTASASDKPIGPKFLRIMDINKSPWIQWETVPYCHITDDEFPKYALKKGDVVIARMADPGHGALIEQELDAVFASYLIRFRPHISAYARYVQYWLRSNQYWQIVDGLKTGTTRASLNAQALNSFRLLMPPEVISLCFAQLVNNFRDQIVANNSQSYSLTATRDALLPKLLSGEMRVNLL